MRKVHFKPSGGTVGAGALLHVRADHVSTKHYIFFFMNVFDLICELTNEIALDLEGGNRNTRILRGRSSHKQDLMTLIIIETARGDHLA